MKYTYTLALVALLFGCSPKDPKPAQSYLGVYQEVYQYITEYTGVLPPSTVTRSGSVTLTNGIEPNQIAISYPSGDAVIIQTDGPRFTFPFKPENSFDLEKVGSGEFTATGYKYQYVQTATGVLSQTVTAVGTRQ